MIERSNGISRDGFQALNEWSSEFYLTVKMYDQSILTHVEKIMKNNVKKCHIQQKCKIYVAFQRTYEILYGNYSDTRCPNCYHFSYIFCYIQHFSLFLLRINDLYDWKLKINRTFH